MDEAWGKYKDPVRIDGKVVKNSEWVKEPDVEVIGADCNHNVDSQPDYTPSAPPEELVTGLYPSLEGLEEELNRDVANEEVVEGKEVEEDFQDLCLMCANSQGEEKQPLHERIDCRTVIYNFGHNCQRCEEEDIIEAFYQCAQCRPEYDLCEVCFSDMRTMAANPGMYVEVNDEHAHHTFSKFEKSDNHSPALATETAIYEEKPPPPPEIFCVSCLIPGHQGGRKCRRPKDQCKNCGHEHTGQLLCKEVEWTLEHGGNPLNLDPTPKTKDTPIEDLCPNCNEMRHHSGIPCEHKEKKETIQNQETLNPPDHSPKLAVPMPMGKEVAKEAISPDSPKVSYRDALLGSKSKKKEPP